MFEFFPELGQPEAGLLREDLLLFGFRQSEGASIQVDVVEEGIVLPLEFRFLGRWHGRLVLQPFTNSFAPIGERLFPFSGPLVKLFLIGLGHGFQFFIGSLGPLLQVGASLLVGPEVIHPPIQKFLIQPVIVRRFAQQDSVVVKLPGDEHVVSEPG